MNKKRGASSGPIAVAGSDNEAGTAGAGSDAGGTENAGGDSAAGGGIGGDGPIDLGERIELVRDQVPNKLDLLHGRQGEAEVPATPGFCYLNAVHGETQAGDAALAADCVGAAPRRIRFAGGAPAESSLALLYCAD